MIIVGGNYNCGPPLNASYSDKVDYHNIARHGQLYYSSPSDSAAYLAEKIAMSSMSSSDHSSL